MLRKNFPIHCLILLGTLELTGGAPAWPTGTLYNVWHVAARVPNTSLGPAPTPFGCHSRVLSEHPTGY